MSEIGSLWAAIAGTSPVENKKFALKLVEAAVNEKDPANVHVQSGRLNNATVKYGMFCVTKNAVWAADTLLRKEGYPLATISFPVNRSAFKLQPGDPVRIVYTPRGIDKIYRVTQIEEQAPTDESITVTAVEDVYYLSAALPKRTSVGYESIAAQTALQPLDLLYVTEMPYSLVGEKVVVISIIGRETGTETGYKVYLSTDQAGSSYVSNGFSSVFNQHGVLVNAYPNTTNQIDETVGLEIEFDPFEIDQIESITEDGLFGTQNLALLVGVISGSTVVEEIISFETITPVTATRYKLENIYRGRFDTTLRNWPAGAHFFFVGQNRYFKATSSELLPSVTRKFKFLPYNGREISPLESAQPYAYTVTGRAYTPLSVVNLAINGLSEDVTYPDGEDIIITWDPRTRVNGAGMQTREAATNNTTAEGTITAAVYKEDPEGWFSTKLRDLTVSGNQATYAWTDFLDDVDFLMPIGIKVIVACTLTGPDGKTYTATNFITARRQT